ncbi:MAG: TonB-dependent receptor [Sphingomonadales bacterium]|nr:TonB-dependent receptor [Sphingomonadales bacterium]
MREIWVGVVALLAASTPAGAQEPAPVIVVTAPGGDEARVSDLPANAQLLGGDALTRQNPSNIADLLDAGLGSVSVSNASGSPYQNDVSYRGFQATSLLGAATGLSVWLDGIPMNEPFGGNVNWDLIPVNAIARVEVLPGSNPVFGLNSLGGTLALTARNGADDGGLSLQAEGGSFARRAFRGAMGGTLGAGTFDWFVAGNHDEDGGYRWYTHTRVDQAYGKGRWHGEGRDAELAVIWSRSRLDGTQGLPLSMLAMPQMAYSWPDDVANDQLIVNLKGDAQLSGTIKLSGNLYMRHSAASAINSNASEDTANCIEQGGGPYACSRAAPTAGTALDLATTNAFAPGTPQNGNFIPYPGPLPIHDYTSAIDTTLALSWLHQHIFGGNALLDVEPKLFGMANDLDLGGSFERAAITYAQTSTLAYLVRYQAVPMASNLRYGSAAGFAGNPQVSSLGVTSMQDSFNLFLRDTLKPTARLSLTASLSVTGSRVTLNGSHATDLAPDGSYSWTGLDGAPYYNPAYIGARFWATGADGPSYLATATVPAGGIAGPQSEPVTGAHRFGHVNPAFGLTWNPAADLNLFASYAQAMRAPTAIELACASPAAPCALPTGFNGDPALKAVVARSAELGARGTVSAVLSWNVAIYRSLVGNDIAFIYNAAGLGYFANVGTTERKGIELGARAQWHRVTLSASYGYVAATYRSSFRDAHGDTVAPGDRITGIPAAGFKLRALYSPSRRITLGADLIASSGQYAHGDEANLYPAVPGYVVVNLDLHLMPVARLELFTDVTNLFDRRYASFGMLANNVYTGADEEFLTPAPPRAIVAGLRYAFGAAAKED